MHKLSDADSGSGPELLSDGGWRSLAGLVPVVGGEMDGLWGWPRSNKHRPGHFTDAAPGRPIAACWYKAHTCPGQGPVSLRIG